MTEKLSPSIKSRNGGKREGAGRKKGVPNKATASLRDIAREYTQEALLALVSVLRDESGAAKVAAAREILDRGYGKATTVLAGDPDGGAIRVSTRIELVGVLPSAYQPD